MGYPITFLKGISNKQDVVDGVVSAVPFRFDPYNPRQVRGSLLLQSICWEDDDKVPALMMNQRKDNGDIQFKAGIARVPRACISYINTLNKVRELLSYEREMLPENPYHGNLTLDKTANKPQRDIVSAMLAGHVQDFIPRNESASL